MKEQEKYPPLNALVASFTMWPQDHRPNNPSGDFYYVESFVSFNFSPLEASVRCDLVLIWQEWTSLAQV